MLTYGGILNRSDEVFDEYYRTFSVLTNAELDDALVTTFLALWEKLDRIVDYDYMMKITAITNIFLERNINFFNDINLETLLKIEREYEVIDYNPENFDNDIITNVQRLLIKWFSIILSDEDLIDFVNSFMKKFKYDIRILDTEENMQLYYELYFEINRRDIQYLMNDEELNNIEILGALIPAFVIESGDRLIFFADQAAKVIDQE